jgi:methionyl-tRNA formyltransferase
MGTPEFAVASLDMLVRNNYNIVAVVTVPDKPAGRGQQIQESAVKIYAKEKGLLILQPEKLKEEKFLSQLRELNADLQIVVAFRMLPEVVWNMPPLGTFNLHGSLLPQYRGAAPINRAIMNGEKETGVTTFFLQHEIDTGKILFTERCPISENDTAGEVHDKLMMIGAELVLKTVKAIEEKSYTEKDQEELITKDIVLHHAPKIFKEDCKIDWNMDYNKVHDHIRGLSPYPGAFTTLQAPDGRMFVMKVFRTEKDNTASTGSPGKLRTDSKTFISVEASNGSIRLLELQIAGKKRMSASEFLRGFAIDGSWKML